MQAFDAELSKLEAGHEEWEELFSGSVSEFTRELCADPRRSNYPSCAKFHANSTTAVKEAAGVGHAGEAATALRSSLRGAGEPVQSGQLHWSAVVASAARKGRGATKGLAPLSREQLHHAKWHGKIPKVACIAAVPSGRDAQARLKYFINNFLLQSYEGPKQLVLVYRHADVEMAKLVKARADGALIKAVASRDEGQFPSTASLRYGAWSAADADVIARWNFDEWHHPDRLSMQVRALALTSRPASLLKRWTILAGAEPGNKTVVSDDLGWEGALVGEAKWMGEHWMPLLGEERAILAGVQAHAVAQVDMPELSVYNMVGPKGEADALRHFGIKDPASVEGSACSEAAAHKEPGSSIGLGKEIGSQAGEALGETYLVLASRRRGIARRLHMLCTEATEERDPLRRERLLSQAETMSAIQKELDQHFGAVEALYHAGLSE